MSLPTLPVGLVWLAAGSFVGSFLTSKIPGWLPVGALIALQLLQVYPLK